MGNAVHLDCDHCGGSYPVNRKTSHAYFFVTDPACNHVKTKCPLCGHHETVFLTAEMVEQVITRGGALRVQLKAHGTTELRRRSEAAWAAVKAAPQPDAEPATFDLTPRLEEDVARFAASLETMPDDLLWDGMESDHERPWPERWA